MTKDAAELRVIVRHATTMDNTHIEILAQVWSNMKLLVGGEAISAKRVCPCAPKSTRSSNYRIGSRARETVARISVPCTRRNVERLQMIDILVTPGLLVLSRPERASMMLNPYPTHVK